MWDPYWSFQVKYGRHIIKKSSVDEIANVSLFTTISHTFFKIPKNRP